MGLGAPRARRFTVLRAAAMFDGVSSALVARPSVVVADGTVAAVHGAAGPLPADAHVVDLPGAPRDLAAAGLGPAEVLQAMTSRAAQACGLGHRKGRIAPGFDADILAIDGNPLDDLAAIRRLRTVYVGGAVVPPAVSAASSEAK